MKLLKLLGFMGKYTVPYIFGIAVMTVSARVFTVIKAFLVKEAFDHLRSDGVFLPIFSKYILFGIILLVIYMFSSYIYKKESKRGDKLLRQKVFDKVMRLPLVFFNRTGSGDIISKYFYDTAKASDVYSAKLRRFAAPIISSAVYLVPMLILNIPLTLMLLAVNTAAFVLSRIYAERTKISSTEISALSGKAAQAVNSIADGIAEIKIFGISGRIYKNYTSLNKEYFEKENELAVLSAKTEGIAVLFDFLCSLAFPVVGGFLISVNMADIGALAAIYTLYGEFSAQFLLICRYYPELMGCLASADKVFSLLEEPDEEYGKMFSCPDDEKNFLEIKNVSFSYGDRKILNKISFAAEKGKITVLKGASGCGKSTLLKIILGFENPDSGDIYAKYTDLPKLRKSIAYVPQEPYIFNVSAEDNIRYGKPAATEKEIVNAAKKAAAHDFLSSKADGYKTQAGERGSHFSGGERQRIALARAYLKNADIYLLDEATSAIDLENERIVLDELRNNKTVIMSAHRESVLALADKIIEMQ